MLELVLATHHPTRPALAHCWPRCELNVTARVTTHRVMYPVHVRRHYKPAQYTIKLFRQADIAVVEHGCDIQHDFKDHNRQYRWAQDHDSCELD